MLTKLFYRGPVTSTKESYRDRADLGRTIAIVLLLALAVAVPVLTMSLLTMAPLGEMPLGVAVVVVTVQAAGWMLVATAAVGLVLALRLWHEMRTRLAAVTHAEAADAATARRPVSPLTR